MRVKYAPDIDAVASFGEEDQVRVAAQWPRPQAGKIQFVRIARRTRARMATEVAKSTLQFVNETERRLLGVLAEVVGNGIFDVLARKGARNDGLDRHLPAALRTRLRSFSK